MDEKQKKLLSVSLLGISEKCAKCALVVAGVTVATHMVEASAAIPTEGPGATQVSAAKAVTAAPSAEGAILLNILRRDPVSGEMVAGHHSHASHASHDSHASHYSSRY